MLAIEGEPGLGVIELFWVPLYEREILSVVLAMTFHARRRSRCTSHQSRVISTLLLQARADVSMAIEAAKIRRRRRDRVALGAGCGSGEVLMSLRERPWRDLPTRGKRQQKEQRQQPEEPDERYRQPGGTVRCGRIGLGALRSRIRGLGSVGCHRYQMTCGKQSRFQRPAMPPQTTHLTCEATATVAERPNCVPLGHRASMVYFRPAAAAGRWFSGTPGGITFPA